VLWGVVNSWDSYRDSMGLGANSFGAHSTVGINAVGAVSIEIVMTFLFVFTVLSATRKAAPPLVAGAVIGLALTVVHLIGIPMTGTSVNPARSIGPALFVGGYAISQLWVFILAPMVGGALAAFAHEYFFPKAEDEPLVLPEVPDQRTQTAEQEAAKAPAKPRQR
jgi:aquaporin Z